MSGFTFDFDGIETADPQPISTISAISTAEPAKSQDYAEAREAVDALADRFDWNDQERAEAHEDAWSESEPFLARLTATASSLLAEPRQAAGGDSGAAVMPLRNPDAIAVSVEYLTDANECNGCMHLDADLLAGRDGRRKWIPVCLRGHRPLRVGYRSETLAVAPPECFDFQRPDLTGPGVFH